MTTKIVNTFFIDDCKLEEKKSISLEEPLYHLLDTEDNVVWLSGSFHLFKVEFWFRFFDILIVLFQISLNDFRVQKWQGNGCKVTGMIYSDKTLVYFFSTYFNSFVKECGLQM